MLRHFRCTWPEAKRQILSATATMHRVHVENTARTIARSFPCPTSFLICWQSPAHVLLPLPEDASATHSMFVEHLQSRSRFSHHHRTSVLVSFGQETSRQPEAAVRSLHRDGLVVRSDVVPHDQLNKLNSRMVEDARALQARGKDMPFNYNVGKVVNQTMTTLTFISVLMFF